jgi:diguanylate cyclase (GGDEF)-like protein
MDKSQDMNLSKKLDLQLTITDAILSGLSIEQILYTILAGIIHTNGLDFDRAFLFLAEENGHEFKAFDALGPSDKTAAEQTKQAKQDQKIDLDALLDDYQEHYSDPDKRVLVKKLAGFVMPKTATVPPIPDDEETIPVQAIIARCAAFNEPFLSNSIKAFYHPPTGSGIEEFHFSHICCVPLAIKNSVIGVLFADNFYSQRLIQDEECIGLSTIGNLAAIAINQARLQNRINQAANLDGLTGVINHRNLEKRLIEEVSRAQPSNRPLSLMLISIDQFENLDSTHGFDAGDRILQDLASFLIERVRTEDIVARFDQGTFAVLLTGGATKEDTHTVAKKLWALLNEFELGGLSAESTEISIGATWQKPDQLDNIAMLQNAAQALKQATDNGPSIVML